MSATGAGSSLSGRTTHTDGPLSPLHPSAAQNRPRSKLLRIEKRGSQYGTTNISGSARVVVGDTYHNHEHAGNSIILQEDTGKQVALNQSLVTSGEFWGT